MKTTLYLVRHAESEGNAKGLFHGWTDSSITDRGHEQAKNLAHKLKNINFEVIISSPMIRAKETAKYLAEFKNYTIELMEPLKEINGGDWEGLSWDELKEKWPLECYNWNFKPHLYCMQNGESIEEFQKRMIIAINQIINIHRGKSIAVFTHATCIKVLLCYFKGMPLEDLIHIQWCENTALTIVEHSGDKFEVVSEGDNSHLPVELTTEKNQGWRYKLQEVIKTSALDCLQGG